MAVIHLAGSIALFLFGGVITIFGLVTLNSSYNYEASSGWLYFYIGVVMIVIGVVVAMLSKSK